MYGIGQGATMAMSMARPDDSGPVRRAVARAVPPQLNELAGRIPQRWRQRVPMRLRNALVDRLGSPREPFDPDAYPARVNLGCGYDKRPGFLNVDLNDFHDPDLVGDVRSLPALPTGRYTEIVAQDVLEHLDRTDGPRALAEWRRLAAPGAKLTLRVPDLPGVLRWLQREDTVDHHRTVIHHMFGTQAYSGDFHLNGFTELLLCDELFRAGFGARRDGAARRVAVGGRGDRRRPVAGARRGAPASTPPSRAAGAGRARRPSS